MKKNITFFLLGLFAFMLIWLSFKGCDSKPTKIEEKVHESLNLNALQKRITDSINLIEEAKIKALYKKDSIQKVSIKSLSTERNRLLAIVRGFQGAMIDTINQTVNDIPIAVYEAEMNANAMCDTLLQFKDVQISIRDSVIHLRGIELQACENMNKSNEQALSDLIALRQQDKKRLKRAKSLNKKIPLIGAICAVGGYILATFALR